MAISLCFTCYNFAAEFNNAIVQRMEINHNIISMKKKSHKTKRYGSTVPNQGEIAPIDSAVETLDLQEIIGEFCQALVGFYGKLKTFQTQIPKSLRR